MKEIEKAITLLIIITSLLEMFRLIGVALYYFHIKDVKTIQKIFASSKKRIMKLLISEEEKWRNVYILFHYPY